MSKIRAENVRGGTSEGVFGVDMGEYRRTQGILEFL